MSAIISPCGLFRLRLDRDLGRPGPAVAVLGVNPSTADATTNDATIRKDIGFGARRGWGRLIKGNKFAYRATDVRELRSCSDPIGPGNDNHLLAMMQEADIVIAAWGPLSKLPRSLRERWRDIVRIAAVAGKPLHCFGVAQDGQPRHTLMLAYDTPLTLWSAP
ncbi:DUF1643 domain-containing protein [Bosea sp. SSUT16]|uniref:DUF1643 domain-containing protein n=1 Tax=Bosea spartocytisi TaxID=2773451 RepID=A0A927E4N4_9HYPH|nr:DUF1643 domain-containing protein [Bosea spartocytisi]MBD3844284.1 DUF1643 domain-containing protein [Bosea spartocytisi]MCT4470610.1 DUF1643 domain-containing protein [Bosea spartocytisi]